MSLKKSVMKAVLNDPKTVELNEEWNNFVKRIGEVTNLVRDMSSGDKEKAEAATILADQYLEGKVIVDEDVKLKVKDNRTLINEKAFKLMEKADTGEMDKETFMASMSKDAEMRAHDRKIRRERAETFKNQAMKAFRREEYDKALSCYNKAIEQVRDNPTLLCDRALTNIKLGNFEKVFEDCHWAERLNESSFKARLYRAKAYKELGQMEKLEECKKELAEKFPQHAELVQFFLEKKDKIYKKEDQEEVENEEEEEEKTDTIVI